MKNLILIASITGFSVCVFAQGIPASHNPAKKNIVLEIYGGIHCTYCPDGDRVADQIAIAHPGKVFLINVHAGGYAVPNTGEPDFRTSAGDYLDSRAGSTSNPAASVNRHVFPSWSHTSGKTAISRTYWSAATTQLIAEDAYANIGAEATIDVQSKLLTVNVQVYYTGAPPVSTNRVHAMLIQNNIEGPQIGSSFYPDYVLPNGNYNHQHALRAAISPTTGKSISSALNNTVNEVFTYLIPDEIKNVSVDMENLQVVVFVTENIDEIINAEIITPSFTNFPTANNSRVVDVEVKNDAVCGFTTAPIVTIQNYGSSPLTSLYINYSINNSPIKYYYWTGNIDPIKRADVTLNNISYFPDVSNMLTLSTSLPNGSEDGDNTDDEITLTFPSAPDVSNTINMTLKLDNYGAEVSWELVNSSGTELYSGGPYQNSNPATVNETFTITSGDCYEFRVHDSETDGILGTGKGFTLQDDQNVIIISNFSKYGAGASIPFGVDAPQPDSTDVFTGVRDNGILSQVEVYPNPTSGKINIKLPTFQSGELMIYLTNSLGQTVSSLVKEGNHGSSDIQIDASGIVPGIYFLKLVAGESRYSEKIVVTF